MRLRMGFVLVTMRRLRALTGVVLLSMLAPMTPGSSTAQLSGGLDAIIDPDDFVGPCDDFDESACLFPFPNDVFTTGDSTTDTGRRINFSSLAMPANAAVKHPDPREWNRNDGFSPSSPILTTVPGIDLSVTGAPPITDMARSLDPDSPMVIIRESTLERHPFWAELDTYHNPPADRQALILRPSINFAHGERYIVALRNLKYGDGTIIQPSESFRRFRDRSPSDQARVRTKGKGRPYRMEQTFDTLEAVGIARSSLFLAWDFTIASSRNLTERLLHIRDEAFGELGSAAPTFTVERVTNLATSEDARIARRVEGHFLVPSYLDKPGGPPGSVFNYAGDDDGLPERIPGNVQVASYVCNIPRSTVSDAANPLAEVHPGSAALYGHGLLSDRNEVNSQTRMANEHNFVFCATDFQGYAEGDQPILIAGILGLPNGHSTVDRLQQSLLNQLFLGRLMVHPAGFVSHPAFRAGTPPIALIDTSALSYLGNSGGGILGGALTALAQDFTRAVLRVPLMSYLTSLTRNVSFDTEPDRAASGYTMLSLAYPDHLDQQLWYALGQMLFDRAEANGYAHHMTSAPLPNTPAHQVLLQMAFCDHLLANVATEVEARTIGAFVRQPALPTGTSPDVVPQWNIPAIPSYPFVGSALVVWSFGNPAPPTGNVPPRPPQYGEDPHATNKVGVQASSRLQTAVFLRTGQVIDVCGGEPCLAP